MAHRSLVAEHLQQGGLVAPFEMSVAIPAKMTMWVLPGSGRGNLLGNVMEILMQSALGPSS